ncbi:hypothetical protein BBD42_17605 [Paenibacillus sp. BIHB 4019]|uniref:Mor transcription activator domain-containing protein n=1 Tax=Paenibacillus sp. BIHB 4019 TaxID=1870819 RepID=A0A1B2DK39_9BACL|nr:hypothetical protein BBD42_17605 [Paenibacillus sp. BIHB 4019]
MKYENGSDILPEELLREVQKYASGKLLYIPAGEEKRAWGAASGYREQLQRRNRMIRNKYAHGRTVSELADEYFLSLDSIKKILYSKKQDDYAAYSPTIESAVKYANGGMLEEWMYCYWQLSKNAKVEKENVVENRLYFGIVKFPLRLIQRDELDIGNSPANATDEHDKLPPLIIEYHQGKFYCTEQKGLLAGLIQRKANSYPTIIVLREGTDYKRFMNHFGTVLFFVK